MLWFQRYFSNERIKFAPEPGEGGGGGGGAGDKGGDKGGEGGGGDKGGEKGSSVTLTRDQYDGIMSKLAKLEGKPPADDPDLLEKAKRDREAADKNSSDSKALEAALKFNLTAKDWIKTNASLLPKDIENLFQAADKENYSNAVEKDAAIKSGIIQSFFSVQENLDLLTSAQKSRLEDYLKLTKTGKQDKAQELYDSIFEPTFEMLKRVKKQQALSGGFGNQSDADNAYRKKLIEGSKKHYLGEKAQ